MTSPDLLFDRFTEAWRAGERPDVDACLAAADPADRALLADRIALWLEVAPAPAFDDETWEAVRAEPAVASAAEGLAHPAGLWPSMLPRLRRRAQLGVAELAERIAGPLGIRGREAKAARYLEDLEAGRLSAAQVSRRVIDALADVLRVSADELARAGDVGRAAPAGGPLFRAADPGQVGEQLIQLADALLAPAPAPSKAPVDGDRWDEVDALFRGGR